jgi:diguanylate cyclase (GGDEF)-like protein
MRCKDQSYKAVETRSKTHTSPAGKKTTICFTRETGVLGRLVEELEEANARLQELASRDALTGAANRRKFNERLEQLVLESNRGRAVALIICDIDHFKLLNDTHGHQAGDDTLVEVARLLMSVCREMDTVCRIGGEEFAVLLPGCCIEGAVGLAERMRIAIEGMSTGYEPTRMSFGVCESLGGSDSETALFSRADSALYAAKAKGRNRVERFEPGMEESSKYSG